ncbi:uncharacterized protein LOC8285823 [Ricinus communis]|uniref:Uncharacterized protein n=1 Tax=Ricinus communis TaxID=3988 RepID=B9SFJ5_RICCO|nr:uncharacterized protein LOC8285823 [Ricinus communis]EEF37607.1 conserved hypothetical protein [Ricinus communis]|eukprot:XP_002524764.1 uncharacterized protein LOC8285823 [Ricinus communis]
METLVVVNQHRNHQYYSRLKSYKPARCGYSSPTSHFREINCRTFESGAGILPTPFRTCTTPVTHTTPTSTSQKTPPPTIKTHALASSLPISINIPTKGTSFDDELGITGENSPFSERWAGPAYSNSPPPSSLPIPKFSMRPKRTVSLELPVCDSGIKVHSFAKSAPSSPTREHNSSTRELLLSVDSATKTLRRILNLDVVDDEI